jgi:hypothetical protein
VPARARQIERHRPGGPRRRKGRRQTGDDELRQSLRPVEVLQPVLAHVAELDVRWQLLLDQPARDAREQNLAAVRRRRDPRRTVNAEADVALATDTRLAGVQAHPHLHVGVVGPLVLREGSLPCNRGGDRVLRTRKRHEEGIPLCVDLTAVVFGEDSA